MHHLWRMHINLRKRTSIFPFFLRFSAVCNEDKHSQKTCLLEEQVKGKCRSSYDQQKHISYSNSARGGDIKRINYYVVLHHFLGLVSTAHVQGVPKKVVFFQTLITFLLEVLLKWLVPCFKGN